MITPFAGDVSLRLRWTRRGGRRRSLYSDGSRGAAGRLSGAPRAGRRVAGVPGPLRRSVPAAPTRPARAGARRDGGESGVAGPPRVRRAAVAASEAGACRRGNDGGRGAVPAPRARCGGRPPRGWCPPARPLLGRRRRERSRRARATRGARRSSSESRGPRPPARRASSPAAPRARGRRPDRGICASGPGPAPSRARRGAR